MKLTLIFINIFIAQILLAQTPLPPNLNSNNIHCGFDAYLNQNRKNANFISKELAMNNKILWQTNSNLRKSTDTITLPVVVHIISKNPSLVTDLVVLNGMQDLNDAFAKSGFYNNNYASDTKIKFCLAKTNPEGGITNGITRTSSFFTNYLNVAIEDAKLKDLIQWNPNEYINIWLIEDMEYILESSFSCGNWTPLKAGAYATIPPNSDSLDGIVISGFGFQLTHSMGHYLGLYHTYEGGCNNNNSLVDGDKVNDTSPDGTVKSSNCSGLENYCYTDSLSGFAHDTTDPYHNFMDWASCNDNFTAGQGIRMQNTINTQRAGLLIPKCLPPCSDTSLAYFIKNIDYPVNGDTVFFTNKSVGGSNFRWYLNDTLLSTSNTNWSYVFGIAGKYNLLLKVFNTDSTCFASYNSKVFVTCGVTARFFPNHIEKASELPLYPDSILFTNTSFRANQFEWYVSNDKAMAWTLLSTDSNFTYTPPTYANYFIKLVAKNGVCVDTTLVQSFKIHNPIPNLGVQVGYIACFQDSGILTSFAVCNYGYGTVPPGIPLSFYERYPKNFNANYLNRTFYTQDSIKGVCCSKYYEDTVFYNHTGYKTINYSINDTGFKITPVKYTNVFVKESNYSDNIVGVYTNEYKVSLNPTTITTALPTDVVQIQAFPNESTNIYEWSSALNLSCTSCQTTFITIDSNRTKQVITQSKLGCRDTAIIKITVPPYNDFQPQITNAVCDRIDSISINFNIKNNFAPGKIYQDIKVAFYNGNPSLATAKLLPPIFTIPNTLNATSANYFTKVKAMAAGNLWIVVNDSSYKLPIGFPSTRFVESNYTNNAIRYAYDPTTYTIFNPIICEGQQYLTHTTTGVYRDTFTAASLCDSVRVINLTVNPRTYLTINKTICEGQFFLGRNVSGTYLDTLVNSNGCDSVRTLILLVNTRTYKTVNTTICEGQNFVGYYTTGIFIDTLINSNGCDSVRTINLLVNPRTYFTINKIICEGQLFLGRNVSGTYLDTLVNSNGCDSVRILNLLVNPRTYFTINKTICLGQNYLGYNKTGSYNDTLVNDKGCDSVRTINLYIALQTAYTETQTICEGQQYWSYKTTGIFKDTFANSYNCDSVRTLNLTVNPRTYFTINKTICEGQSFLGRNITGVFNDTLINSNGCDSIRILNLLVNPRTYFTINKTICEGQSFLSRVTTGTFNDTLFNSKGCDSVRTLNLQVNPRTYFTINKTICQGQNYLGKNLTGSYSDTLINSNGCDSIRTLNLIVINRVYDTLNLTICQGSNITGHTVTGTYTDTFIAKNTGCDSVRTLNLLVTKRVYKSIDATICEGKSYLGYTIANTYYDTLISSQNCDSIRVLFLKVLPIKYNKITVEICDGEMYFVQGAFRATTGNYYDTLIAANGCDSVLTTFLNVKPSPKPNLGKDIAICKGDSTIIDAGFYNTYLWNTGETTPEIYIKTEGLYFVNTINNYNCPNADSINLVLINCNNIIIPNAFSPNGDNINDVWDIKLLQYFSNCTVNIFNRWGQLLYTSPRGYTTPWNGIYKGQKVPLATYYYIVEIPEIKQKLSGSVTVLY